MARAAEVSAHTLGVRRVGVWTYDVEHGAMRCLHLYDDVSGHSTPGTSLSLLEFAPYAAALESARTIVADDAFSHPATRCLAEAYLAPRGIRAMLDAPVYRSGEVVGVVCHEHVGGTRHWTEQEIDFACSVADMLGSLAEQATRLELVAALHQHQKMEALGRLAGDVAHDFQNLLSVVLIHAARIHGSPNDAAVALESSLEIQEAAEEGALLTKRLQAFAEPQRSQPQRIWLGEVAKRMEPILGLLAKKSVQLSVRRETSDDEVVADPWQLEEVLLGLVTVARDALGGKSGRISVIVRAPTPDETVAGSPCVALEVRSYGANSALDLGKEASAPLLTTRLDDSDVGLIAVRNIVQPARGTLQFSADAGEGATFTVTWPLVR